MLEGSEGTPFAGGYYYGKIKFPPEYLFKPPGISMTTPNGRFATQKKICLSLSDFTNCNLNSSSRELEPHVVCLKMDNSPTTGSVTTSASEKQCLAKASLAFNCKNATFRKMFPEHVEKYNEQQLSEQAEMEVSPAAAQDEVPKLHNPEALVNQENPNRGRSSEGKKK